MIKILLQVPQASASVPGEPSVASYSPRRGPASLSFPPGMTEAGSGDLCLAKVLSQLLKQSILFRKRNEHVIILASHDDQHVLVLRSCIPNK